MERNKLRPLVYFFHAEPLLAMGFPELCVFIFTRFAERCGTFIRKKYSFARESRASRNVPTKKRKYTDFYDFVNSIDSKNG